jgi:hypothetical protein
MSYSDYGMAKTQAEHDSQEPDYGPYCEDCGRQISHGTLCRPCLAERRADAERDEYGDI